MHDLEDSLDLSSMKTYDAFSKQWKEHEEGKYLLSDPWFKDNVARILFEEEIQIKKEWFKEKNVLDAGCGNGRWTYGFAELGANITAIDISQIAIEKTKTAVKDHKVRKEFVVSPLETLSKSLSPTNKYDLVFSWGVLHHAKSFNKSLKEIIQYVKEDGILYLYLYGRESISYEDDIELFKERILYNSLPTEKDKIDFLLKKAKGNKSIIHNLHDIYAPLVNRRLEFETVKISLEDCGFKDIVRTIDHTELFIRALKGNVSKYYENWLLPKKKPPYWFLHH